MRFRRTVPTALPSAALDLLLHFVEELSFQTAATSGALASSPSAVPHFTGMLRRFRAEFNHLTHDLEGVVLRRTARAFIHLQRSIVVDPDVRRHWSTAYNVHETECEKLGAVHLLHHGIWAFKAHSVGERTDLVLGEPLRDDALDDVYLSAEGLVLTEWKTADITNYREKFEEAFRQADAYGVGSLAPIELKSYRYLVVVSDDYLPRIDDREANGIVYKHINLAVKPSTPSKRARRRS